LPVGYTQPAGYGPQAGMVGYQQPTVIGAWQPAMMGMPGVVYGSQPGMMAMPPGGTMAPQPGIVVTALLHVGENWKKSGNLSGQGKVIGKYFFWKSQGKVRSLQCSPDPLAALNIAP